MKANKEASENFQGLRMLKSIITGRFAKKNFGLDHSLILGDDGGLYVLLNDRTHQNDSILTCDGFLKKAFLASKTKRKKESEKLTDQLVLGEGSFGKVRFAQSLFQTEKT